MKLPGISLSPLEEAWLDEIAYSEDENILWAGRPGRLSQHDGSSAMLFGLIFWIPVVCTAVSHDADFLGWHTPWEQVFMYALVIANSALFSLFPLWKRIKARHTVYVLTNQRAIIQAPGILGRPRHQIYHLSPTLLRDRYVNSRGVGSFVFGYGYFILGLHYVFGWPIGFLNIPDFAKVDKLICHELFHRHGQDPDTVPARHRSSVLRAAAAQLVVGLLLLATWLGPGFSSALQPADEPHTESAELARHGDYTLQAADGSRYHATWASSALQHPHAPHQQVAPAPTSFRSSMLAAVLGGIGAMLILHAFFFYHTHTQYGTT